jgi:Flp pilus assembly protein TadD/4-amino-4-deoxy-L-arabinose transferase-like glycosyltransferase
VVHKARNIHRPKTVKLGIVVFCLAFAIRVLYLYDSSDNPTFYAPIVDSLTYDQMARNLAAGGRLTDEFFWQPPFYPLFLTLVYLLSNFSILFAKIIQALLGAFTSVLAYRLGDRLFGRTAGILAGVFTAVYMPLVFFESELLSDAWAPFWSVALLLILLRAGEKSSIANCFLLGLCGVLSIITRPVFLPFFMAAVIWLLITWRRNYLPIHKFVSSAATIAAGFIVVAVPVALLCYSVTGKARILPFSGGINLYVGNNPDYKETITARPGLQWKKLTDLPVESGIKDVDKKERFFVNRTVEYVLTQPAAFLKGLLYKTMQFFSSREMPRNVNIYLFRKWSAMLRTGVWKLGGFGFPFGLLLPLAVIGAIFGRTRLIAPIWLFLLLYPAAVILVFVASRYRVTIVPVMSVLVANGCQYIAQILRQCLRLGTPYSYKGHLTVGGWLKVALAAMVVLVTVFIAVAPGPFYAEQIDYEPELYYGLADSLDEHGHSTDALQAYSSAITLRPNYVEAHHNLALLLVKAGRIDQALAHYRNALDLDSQNAGIYEDYGVALFKQGKTTDAIDQYQKALQIDPKKPTVYDNLGTAYFNLNQLPQALESYSKAIELNTADPIPHNNIGNVYALTGRPEMAVTHYQLSLKLKPDDPETLNNLANALASLGKFAQATENYHKALQIAPNDAGIYCNLAACLKQQGRIIEAEQAYRKALAINPRHQRARKALNELTGKKNEIE